MEQLDAWTYQSILQPMPDLFEDSDAAASEWNRTHDAVYKAIRAKVLESYKDGLAAVRKPAPARKATNYAQTQTR